MKYVLALSALLFFCSCEKNTYVDFQIKNMSDTPIYVTGHDLIHNWAIKDTILVGQEKNIASWGKFGKDLNPFSPQGFFGDDLLIVNDLGDTSIKDYKVLNNWQVSIDDQRAVAYHTYILEIGNLDFN